MFFSSAKLVIYCYLQKYHDVIEAPGCRALHQSVTDSMSRYDVKIVSWLSAISKNGRLVFPGTVIDGCLNNSLFDMMFDRVK